MLFKIDKKIEQAAQVPLERCEEAFARVDETTKYYQQKLLKAFIDAQVSESHFSASTGYGYLARGHNAK